MPFAVICDGRIIEDTVMESPLDTNEVKKLVISSKIPLKEIIIMTVDSNGTPYIVRKDGEA